MGLSIYLLIYSAHYCSVKTNINRCAVQDEKHTK